MAADIGRGGLEKRCSVQPAVAVEHCSPLVDERLVSEIKRAIEVAKIGFAQLSEKFYRVSHSDPLPEPLFKQAGYRRCYGWLDPVVGQIFVVEPW